MSLLGLYLPFSLLDFRLKVPFYCGLFLFIVTDLGWVQLDDGGLRLKGKSQREVGDGGVCIIINDRESQGD